MAKVLVFLCVVLLAITLIMACSPPGFPCKKEGECCAGFKCNPWICRCIKDMGPWRSAGPWAYGPWQPWIPCEKRDFPWEVSPSAGNE